MTATNLCFRCGWEPETLIYALWNCGCLAKVRERFLVIIDQISGCSPTFIVSIQNWKEILPLEDFEKLVMVHWRAWFLCNKEKHGKAISDEIGVYQWACSY